MKVRAAMVGVLCLAGGPAAATNLVPNPGFESFSSCPSTFSQIELAVVWGKPTDGTSDYHHQCHSDGLVGVPLNAWGSRAARGGQGYAGLYAYVAAPRDYREYVEVKLDQPLDAGVEYEVSMHLSLSGSSRWAVETFGAYLSVGLVGPITGTLPLPFTPQITNTSGPLIGAGWGELSGTYLAAGGEDHIVIGNFSGDANAPLFEVDATGQDWAYYYLDDVSVTGGCTSPPVADAGPDIEVCAQTTVTLDGSASLACDVTGLEYRWLDGAAVVCPWSVVATCDVLPTGTAIYTLEVHCPSGVCAVTDDDTVTVAVLPAVRPADLGNSVRAVRNLADVLLSWSSDPNAVSYNLYRGDEKRVWPAPHVNGLGATTTALPDVFGPLDLYFYRVTGVGCSDLEGP